MKGGRNVLRKDSSMKELGYCLDEYTAWRYLQVSDAGGEERTYTTTYEFCDANFLFKVYKDIERYVLDEGISNAELDSLDWQRSVTIYTGKQLPKLSKRLSQCCIAAGLRDVTQTEMDQRFSAINFSQVGEIVLKNACLADEVRKQRQRSTSLDESLPLPVFGRVLSLVALCGISEICVSDITTILGRIPIFETVARARIASLRQQHPSNVIHSVLFGGGTDSAARQSANKASTFRGERVMVGRIEELGRGRFDTLWENNLCEFSGTVAPRHPVGTPIYMLSGWANLIAHREEIGKRHSSLGNIVQSGCYISTSSTDVHGNAYMHPGSLRSIVFTIDTLSDGSLMAKPSRFDIFDYQDSDKNGTGEEKHFGGIVGKATACGCRPDQVKGKLTLDGRYGDELQLRNRNFVGNAIQHTQEVSAKTISMLWRPGDYPLGVFLMQTLPQSSYLQGKGECLYCAVENAATSGCPEVIVCGGVRESESPRIPQPGVTKSATLPADLQIGRRFEAIGPTYSSAQVQPQTLVPANFATGPVQPLNPTVHSVAGGRTHGGASQSPLVEPIPSPLRIKNPTYPSPRQTSPPTKKSPAGADVDAWLQSVGPFYQDPPQPILETTPREDARAGSGTVFNIGRGASRDPELSIADKTRGTKQAESSLKKFPWKLAGPRTYEWSKESSTGSSEQLEPPPRPPKEPYHETVSDDHLPLRPVTSNTSDRNLPDQPQQSTSAVPRPNYVSSHSDPSLLSLGSSDAQSVGTARPMTITRTQPGLPANAGGQIASHIVPSPPPSNSMFPLPSSSSPVSRYTFETHDSPQHGSDSSVTARTSPRPTINTHVSPVSHDGTGVTPVVEAAPPMTPQQLQPGGQSSRFLRPSSQASSLPPPVSPPPPYKNNSSRTAQRMQSYYAFAEQRSDQIMYESTPLSATHPALRKEPTLLSSSTTPPPQSAVGLSHSAPVSPPIQEPRPLSSFTVMTEDTIDTLPPMRSPPSSLNSESPPISTHASFRNRQGSVVSAPSEESNTRPISPPTHKPTRSYSIPAILSEAGPDLTLQKTESAPGNVKRKPVPPRQKTNVTDTYKETIAAERPSDSLKEVANRSASTRMPDDSLKGLRIYADPGIERYAGPKHKQPDTPTDTQKVFVPESPVEREIQRPPLSQPVSQVDLMRKRNQERRQGQRGGRRLRIMNA